MKNFYFRIILFLWCILLFGGCAEDKNSTSSVNASFVQDTLNVAFSAGSTIAIVESSGTEWKLEQLGDGLIISLSTEQGGSGNLGTQYTKIKINYSENNSSDAREQNVSLINTKTGEQRTLTLRQSAKYGSLDVTIDPLTVYQHVYGFGGMYNPAIWISASDRITSDELNRMYGMDGLGYSILRLMIYPDEKMWVDDVAGAKQAQASGALLFACPWDCTDSLADNVTVNGKDDKHLKIANYDKYADHLIRYINFMKSNGVNLYAVSVQNEPDMDFTHWTPQEIVNFIKQCGAKIRATGVKLMSPEACGFSPDYTDAVLNDVAAFAQTDIVVGHLYQGFIESTAYAKSRHDYISGLYNSKLNGAGKGGWWMTEKLFQDGDKKDDPDHPWLEFQKWSYSMEHLGEEIHECMDGYCSAYTYWYLKRYYGMIADNDVERNAVSTGQPTNNGYILSHFAKYASNMDRIKVESGDPEVLITSYINSARTEITLVLLNMKNSCFNAKLSIPYKVKSASAIETTEDTKMAPIKVNLDQSGTASAYLLAKSIVSIRLILK